MFKQTIHNSTLKPKKPKTASAPWSKPDERQFLVAGAAPKVSTGAKPIRIIGNLLIVIGLLLLVGIGGWYGYTQWDNQRQKEAIATKFGANSIEPPVAQAMQSTPVAPTPTLPPPQPILNPAASNPLANLSRKEDTSPPVRLFIPSVSIDTKVVPVSWKMIPSKGGGQKSEWQVADSAVGHHYGSANPGETGNVVLSGHVDYKGQVFKDLHNANKGDEIILYTEKGQYIYVVTDMVLVKEDGVPEEQKRRNAAYMNPTPDQTLTMITCWPYGIDDHRLIVIAKPYQSPLSTQSEYIIR